MLETKEPHLDDFTLLRYVAFDLDEIERADVARHVEMCSLCRATLGEIEALNQELSSAAKVPGARLDWEVEDLPEGDPFRERPIAAYRPSRRSGDPAEFAADAVAASEEGSAFSVLLLETAKRSHDELKAALAALDLGSAAHRFGLLYALQQASRQIAEDPGQTLVFANLSLERLQDMEIGSITDGSLAESTVPALILLGYAHFLAGQAMTWASAFEESGEHFRRAYQYLARGGAEEPSLAMVEYQEANRRSRIKRGKEGLILARRAARTFEEFGLDDLIARAQVAEGLSLSDLGRLEEAIEAHRRALPVFEKREMWSNYVGAVNNTAALLQQNGQLGEARREYARALRKVSRQQHRYWVALIRHGLAEVLFSSKKYREAAVSVGQAIGIYRACVLDVKSLTATLLEIECWARSGNLDRARHRLSLFQAEVTKLGMVDPTVTRQIQEALAGHEPDFQRLSELSSEAKTLLHSKLGQTSA